MEKTYVVSKMTDYGFGHETCHPLAVGVNKATAKSIYRHFDKLCKWNDYTQTGEYILMVSQQYCTNHEDFERETTLCSTSNEEDIF